MKKMFFHHATCKTRTNCKISTFFEDLNFLNLRNHLKLMSGKGKYLTEICWKLLIDASKALISCIFPENITIFCEFLGKHMYAPRF